MAEETERPFWPVALVLILVGYAFYWGWIAGIVALLIGVVILGWRDRHKGPIKSRDR